LQIYAGVTILAVAVAQKEMLVFERGMLVFERGMLINFSHDTAYQTDFVSNLFQKF